MEKSKALNNNKRVYTGNIVGDIVVKNAYRIQTQESIPQEESYFHANIR